MTTALAPARSLLQELPPWLAEHCARTAQLARKLAHAHDLDPDEAARCAWLHDICRHWLPDRWLQAARDYDIAITPVAAERPVILHGPIGAAMLVEHGIVDYGDPAWHAVCWHTSCRPDATPSELVLFLADKLEPWKLKRSIGALQPALDTAWHDLPQATAMVLDWSVRHLEAGDHPIQPLMQDALAWARSAARLTR